MTKSGTKLFRMFVSFCVVLSYAPLAIPQTTTNGAVEGRVHLAGAPDTGIRDATIVVTNEESGLERSIATNESGNYFVGTLPPGHYTIRVAAPGYESQTITNFAVRVSKTNVVIPPIALQTATVATSQPPVTPPIPKPNQPRTGRASDAEPINTEQLANTLNASRGQNFDMQMLITLPLPGVRSFDDLAFLAPGVAPPPQAIGNSVGPGIGAGVGTSGQFSVNGLRSRSNNFTVDGSDNNDEDIGVRRQGFTSLVPQSIESLQEFQIITLLPEPQFGRKMGAQVNAVSRSGGTDFHGAAYLFYTNNGLRARDTFDAIGAPASLPLTRSFDGQPIFLDRISASGVTTRESLATVNPGGRKQNDLERPQMGFVLGGPLAKPNTFFFTSFEHQHIEGTKESHFAVPTVAQRGFFGTTGETGGFVGVTPIFPTSSFGDAFFSLFPFPNDPIGPYGNNTFTELLPIDADGSIFSVKIDQQNIKAFGKDHTLTGRYNFTDDNTILPVTGEALFSSLRALVRTQNLSLIFNSVISPRTSNQFRFSWGTTRLNFREVRDSLLSPSKLGSPIEVPFLLNAPVLFNATREGKDGETVYQVGDKTVEDIVGPLGQFIVSGFSPVGVDVFNFPQQRTNKTYQLADTVLYSVGAMHRFTMGFDTRLVRLNSLLDRNFRPQAVFSSAPNLASSDPLGQEGSGIGLVGAGAPTGFFQTLTTGPDSRINLRYWQNDFFLTDQIRPRPNITITLGVRYELNTVPTEQDGRIEKTFVSDEVKKFIEVEKREANGVSGLETFLAGRTKIFRPDKNNIAPHIAFAWDPFGKGETSIRAGYGIYYDQIPGAVISQARNVFPSFVTLNTAGFGRFTPSLRKVLTPFNPATVSFSFGNQSERLVLLNTLNRLNPALISRIGGLANFASFLKAFSQGAAGGVGFVLPAADLVTPYAQHWGITVEQQIKRDLLISLAYVGTRGTHLLRFATPNLGPNAIPSLTQIAFTPDDPDGVDFEGLVPLASGDFFQPGGGRPFPLLGAFTSIESDTNSTYNALQVQVIKSFLHGIQFTTAYTWSHAIDEVSDIFDLAGASALPQDSFDRRAERGDANFDVRHRFVYSFIWDLPIFSGDKVFGGWQIANIGTFQTGQPYTIIQGLDVNLDGNLTDRLNNTAAIKQVHEGSVRFTFDKSLNALSLGSNGVVGRNTFRAPGIVTVDMAVNKHFRFKERHGVEFRSELFNLFNHSNFGIPVHQVGFPGFGQSVDLRVPRRSVQFGLKYTF